MPYKFDKIDAILDCIVDFYCLPSYYSLKYLLNRISKSCWIEFCRENTIYLIETRELVEGLSLFLRNAPKPILEVFAGRGKLAYWLRRYGVDVIATDDYSWKLKLPRKEVIKLSASEALQIFSPQTVIASWIPANENFGMIILNSSSVKIFLDISSGVGSDSSWTHQYTFIGLKRLADAYGFSVYPLNDLAFLSFSQETDPSSFISNNSHVYVFIRRGFALDVDKYLLLG